MAGEAYPTRVLEAEHREGGTVRLVLWTGTADGRFRGIRTIDLDLDAVCIVAGRWAPPTATA